MQRTLFEQNGWKRKSKIDSSDFVLHWFASSYLVYYGKFSAILFLRKNVNNSIRIEKFTEIEILFKIFILYRSNKKSFFDLLFKGSIWTLRIHHRYSSNTSHLSTVDCRPWLVKFVLVSSLIVNVITGLILILFLIRLVLIIKRHVFPQYTILTL